MNTSVEFVKPTEPTVLGGSETYDLNPIDILWFPVDFVMVVPGPIDLDRLKGALSQTLAAHPVYGGRIVRPEKTGGIWQVNLKTAGVPFYIRDSDDLRVVPIDTIAQQPLTLTNKVNVQAYYRPASDEPLMTVTVTRFNKIGETAIGLSTSHAIGDAYTLLKFFRFLSNSYQGLDTSSFHLSYAPMPPVQMSSDKYDKVTVRYDKPYDVLAPIPDWLNPAKTELPERVDFRLTGPQLAAIKRAVLAQHIGEGAPARLSAQDCLAAVIAPCVSHADSEQIPVHTVGAYINHRGMGPTPAEIAGNCVMETWSETFTPEASEYEIARGIRESYKLLKDDDYVVASILNNEQGGRKGVEENLGFDFSAPAGHLVVNSTRAFDYVATDFGYTGKARFYHTNLRGSRYIKMFTPNPTRLEDGTWKDNKGSAEVNFHLPVKIKPVFEEVFRARLKALGVEGEVDFPRSVTGS